MFQLEIPNLTVVATIKLSVVIARQEEVHDKIEATQLIAVAQTLGQKSPHLTPNLHTPSVVNLTEDDTANANPCRPPSHLTNVSPSYSTSSLSLSHFGGTLKRASSHFGGTLKRAKNSRQPLIWSGAPNHNATAHMDVAVADMIHSNAMPSAFSRDLKLFRCLEHPRKVPVDYITPDRRDIGGPLHPLGSKD